MSERRGSSPPLDRNMGREIAGRSHNSPSTAASTVKGIPIEGLLIPDLITGTNLYTDTELLNTVYKFKEGAPLEAYLARIMNIKPLYTLAEILTIIKIVIAEGKMFDERNPSVILCSGELERALDQKALHVREVRETVLKQLLEDSEHLGPMTLGEDSNDLAEFGNLSLVDQPERAVQPQPLQPLPPCYPNPKFRLKPLFLAVIRSVDEVNQKQTIFTYEEISRSLARYILTKRDSLFDQRNPRVALVRDDLLGAAFGVSAFHRCQLRTLLRAQLIPVLHDCHPNAATYPGPSMGATGQEG